MYIFTVIMFIFSLIRSACFGVFAIMSIFIDNAIAPVVIMTVMMFAIAVIALHYYMCIKYLRNYDAFSEKSIRWLSGVNMALVLLYGYVLFAISIVLLYSLVVFKAIEILPYFLPQAVISVPYFVHGILWRWKIEKSKKDLVQ